jgi:chromosome segregation ATPase
MTTTESEPIARSRQGLCEFPGVSCANPKQVDPGTPGRPPKYCGREGAGVDGKPVVHNKANAWAAKNRLARQPVRRDGAAAARSEPATGPGPVTAARMTLEQLMKGNLPRLVEELEGYLAQIAEAVRTYGDAEAVAAEVEQLQAASRAELADAERQRGQEEQRRRRAEQQAAEAEDAREEADEAAQEAVAALDEARVDVAVAEEAAAQARRDAAAARESATAELEQARQELAAVREVAAAELERVRAETEQRIRDLQATAEEQLRQARGEVDGARNAQLAAEAERQTVQRIADELRAEVSQERERHRAELDAVRAEHRADREQLRADQRSQLADVKKAAEDRFAALTAAQRAAEQVAEALRHQLATLPAPVQATHGGPEEAGEVAPGN